MANGESLSSLYMRLGLDFSELNENFVQATQTLRQNMQSLNRENTIIRLQTEVDLTGVEDANERIRIQTQSLNRQIEIQNQRVRLATASLENLTRSTGQNSDSTQRARITLERERLALARLQNELNNVNQTQEETVQGQNSLADSFATVGTKVAGVVATLATVKQGFDFVLGSAEKLREQYAETQRWSYALNLPMQETKDFMQMIRLAGGEVNDLEGFWRGVQSAFATGDNEDREYVALRSMLGRDFDVNRATEDIQYLDELITEAMKNAGSYQRQMELLLALGGDAGAKDAAEYYFRKPEAQSDKKKLSKVDLNVAELHEFDREMKLLTEQTDEFYNALGTAFSPMARNSVQSLFEVVRSGTDFVKDSTDEIQKFGFALDIAGQKLKDFYSEKTGGRNLFDDLLGGAGNLATLTPFGRLIDSLKNTTDAFKNTDLGKEIWEQATKRQQEYSQAMEESNKKYAELNKNAKNETANIEARKRKNKYTEELTSLRNELTNWGDDYSKNLAELDSWYSQVIEQVQVDETERATITELYAAKREKIEREYAEKIAKENEESQQRIKEITQETADIEFAATHSAFEKELRDIEQWKQAQLEKSKSAEETAAIIANAAAKESDAYRKAVEEIKNATQSIEDKIFAQEHSQYEVDLRNLQKEYAEGIAKGIDQKTMDRYYQNALQDLNAKAAKGGEYIAGKNQGGAKYIDLDKPDDTIPLFTDEEKILKRLKSGITPVTDLNAVFPKENNFEMKTPVGNSSALTQNLTTAELQNLIKNLSASEFSKDGTGIYSSPDTDLNNFIVTLQNAGANFQQINSYLDDILQRQAIQSGGTAQNMSVSPNINISVQGNIVADEKFQIDLAERIKDEVYKGVTDAVESATQNNYSFAS